MDPVESLSASLRDKFLNVQWLLLPDDAGRKIGSWRIDAAPPHFAEAFLTGLGMPVYLL